MKTTNRRIALLTGASAAALGMSALAATPALAAPHDTLPAGVYPGTDTTGAVVTICDVAVATPECFFGVIDTGVAATAVVNSTATGRIFHHDNGGAVVPEAAIERCKDGIDNASEQLSEDAKDSLKDICEKAGSGNVEDARDATFIRGG